MASRSDPSLSSPPSSSRALTRYSRDVHYEVLDGIALVQVGKKRDGSPRMGLGIVCWRFLNEKDARAMAREKGLKVFRVDRQRRTELVVRGGEPCR